MFNKKKNKAMKKFNVTANGKEGLFSFSGLCEVENDEFYKNTVSFQKSLHGDFDILSASFSDTDGIVRLSGMLWSASGWESGYTDCLGSIYCKNSEVAKKVLATDPFSKGGYGTNGWFDAPEPSMNVVSASDVIDRVVIDVIEGELVYDGTQETYIMEDNKAAYDYCLENGWGLKKKFISVQKDALFPDEGYDYAIYERAELAVLNKGDNHEIKTCYVVTGSKMSQDEFFSLLVSGGLDSYSQAEKWRSEFLRNSPKSASHGVETDLCDCTICELETTCQICGWNAETNSIEYVEFDNKTEEETKKSCDLDCAPLSFVKGVYRYIYPYWDVDL